MIHSWKQDKVSSRNLFEYEYEGLKKIALLHGIMANMEKSITFWEDALIVLHSLKGRECKEAIEIYNSLGNALHLLNSCKKALFCYKQSLRLMKMFSEEYAAELASIHFKLGLLQFRTKDYNSAIYHYNEATKLEKSPDIVWSILHAMGNAYSSDNKLDDAISCFTKSLEIKKATQKEIDKYDAKINLSLAKAYCDLGSYDQSLQFYEVTKSIIHKLCGENKEYISVLRNIAYVHCKKDNNDVTPLYMPSKSI